MDSQVLVQELNQDLNNGVLTEDDVIQILSFSTETRLVVIDWYYDDNKMQELMQEDIDRTKDEEEVVRKIQTYQQDRSRLKSIRVGLLLSLLEA